MKGLWWKVLAVAILIYVHTAGILMPVPNTRIHETIRGLYFHVPMWFGMVLMYCISVYYAVRHLRTTLKEYDIKSVEYANVGTAFGVLGMLTGMMWANYAWNDFWHNDPKQVCAAIALLIYLAYFVLRGSFENQEQRARLSAVYNVFAFAAMIPLVFIIPRMYNSLHPGEDGNPGFNAYDLDSQMRLVFYPAVIGWFLMGLWITSLRIRYRLANEKILDAEL